MNPTVSLLGDILSRLQRQFYVTGTQYIQYWQSAEIQSLKTGGTAEIIFALGIQPGAFFIPLRKKEVFTYETNIRQ